ncbi:ABC transporter permease [Kordiimonas sp. SCSIO 12610]|nr:ABC transporter permease [Kordiimonas sp. SCSIO 12610]
MFSLINVFGLSIGLMSCILIILFVRDELSYDHWLSESDRIVRLHSAFVPRGQPEFKTVRAPGFWAEAISNYAPDQVEVSVRLLANDTTVIQNGEAFTESLLFSDPAFFQIFKLPFVEGSGETSFNRPLDLVISEESALKYFGRTDVVGETLTFCCLQNQKLEVAVTGVIKDIPLNSHLSGDMIVLMDEDMFDFAPNLLKTWTSVNTYTYFKLKDGATANSLQERIWTWLDTDSPLIQMFADATANGQIEGDAAKVTDVVQPKIMAVPDLHLYARDDAGNSGDMTVMGDIKTVYTFSAIALLILVIASINFMNLATARAAHRAREVALRKTMGASRLQVAVQFLGEAVAITMMALLLAFVGVELALPSYNEVIGKNLDIDLLDDLPLMLALSTATVLVGVISGMYPATYLSRFMPAKTLKSNQSSDNSGSNNFRSILVVLQFSISIGLIVCTGVIYAQTYYAKSFDTGYDSENKLIVRGLGRSSIVEQANALRQELEKVQGVESVVISSEVPSQDRNNNTGFTRLNSGDETSLQTVLNYHSVGYGFFEAYDIKPVSGRVFDKNYGSEEIIELDERGDEIANASVVINQSAVKSLGFASADEAIGETLRSNIFQAGLHDLKIVGVVPDLYFRSLKFGVRPSVYWVRDSWARNATITYSGTDTKQLISEMETIWRTMFPLEPLYHEYLDVMMAAQYQTEEGQAQLFAAFSVLAVLIACLGLYGLAAFTAERRTKEIGIRKVLGATTLDIIRLLVWQFSRPVLIANIIAWPLAWYMMSGWLETFKYRLDDSFIVAFALIAGLAALTIAWTTVASRAFRVAQSNPIKALRYE